MIYVNFGKVTAKTQAIEFQKCGLPHAHILLISDSEFKLWTEDDIDHIIKAEIPDEDNLCETSNHGVWYIVSS